jgi:hypothetical protein
MEDMADVPLVALLKTSLFVTTVRCWARIQEKTDNEEF